MRWMARCTMNVNVISSFGMHVGSILWAGPPYSTVILIVFPRQCLCSTTLVLMYDACYVDHQLPRRIVGSTTNPSPRYREECSCCSLYTVAKPSHCRRRERLYLAGSLVFSWGGLGGRYTLMYGGRSHSGLSFLALRSHAVVKRGYSFTPRSRSDYVA